MHLVGEELRFNIDMTMIWPVEDEDEPEPAQAEVKKTFLSKLKGLFGRRSDEGE